MAALRGQGAAWTLTATFLFFSYWIVARSCGYDQAAIFHYVGYVLLYVWLPGCLVLRGVGWERVSLADLIALGLPVGFAIEILTYLLLSALGLRDWYAWIAVGWVGLLLATQRKWKGWRESLPQLACEKAWIACALAGLLVGVMMTTASFYYAPAPLSHGRLLQSTIPDWVYLVSLAAEIKQRWPLQDPGLAGTPLSYHYFLMVHVAAASRVTGAEISEVLLRFAVLPLSTALLLQGFSLGRTLGRNPWAGVLAVVLLLLASEVSFSPMPTLGTVFDLFTTWLYISPTFFFGMIFLGALVIFLHRMTTTGRDGVGSLAVLGLLAVAASGAKGTIMPALLVAYAAWTGCDAIRVRRVPWAAVLRLGVMGLGFGAVYLLILKHWGTGAAQSGVLVSTSLTQFWIVHRVAWQSALVVWGLPPALGSFLAQAACLAVCLAGSHGVRLLGVTMFFGSRRHINPSLTHWLGWVYLANYLLGDFLVLDSNGQLYLFVAKRLPAAVLAAAAVASFWPAWLRRWQELGSAAIELGRKSGAWGWWAACVYWRVFLSAACGIGLTAVVWQGWLAWWIGLGLFAGVLLFFVPRLGASAGRDSRRLPRLPAAVVRRFLEGATRAVPSLAVVGVLAVQVNHSRLRNRTGFDLWLRESARAEDPALARLAAGLDWVRRHAPINAVLVANAFTPGHTRADHLAVVDRTTVDKYYYYSALSERRLWVEGPAYAYDPSEVERRMQIAAELFAGERRRLPESAPYYLLVDHALEDRSPVVIPEAVCEFRNDRVAIYRMPPM
jgi:hypothetical protein